MSGDDGRPAIRVANQRFGGFAFDLETEGDRFLDAFHQLIQGAGLRVAAVQRGNGGHMEALRVPFDDNVELSVHQVTTLAALGASPSATVADVRQHLNDVRVVNVDDPRFGGAALPFRWKIADPGGAAIVVELVEDGQVKVYDAFLGVITNAPTYDWHLTNRRYYFHTMHNREVRVIDLKTIDFASVPQQVLEDDSSRHHAAREVVVRSR